MITSRGLYTHAIFGFLNMLQKALDEVKPDYITVAFDRKAPTFRHLEYEAYKAGRAKMPDELSMQLPYLKDILAAMNISTVEIDGYEADDLIGTLARRAEAEGLEALIISGDRDELQLVSEYTSVLITKKGVSEFELYTPEAMVEKYGFGAELFVDYKGLMGDASDNIPGLPGIGEKTAAKLVREFGTIENIVENLDRVEPVRIRNIIDEDRQTAFMSKRLATIVTNAPIESGLEEMRVREWDVERLRDIYTELEFKSFLKKLRTYEPGDDKDDIVYEKNRSESCFSSGFEPEKIGISMVESIDGLEMVREALAGADKAALHTLGSDDHVEEPVVYAIFIYVNEKYFCIWTRDDEGLFKTAAEMLNSAGLRLSGHGLKDDLYRLRRVISGGQGIRLSAGFDSGVANYLLAPGPAPTFAQLALTYGGLKIHEKMDFTRGLLAYDRDDIAALGREFCAAITLLEPLLMRRLEDEGQTELFKDVEMPLVETLAEIEAAGFAFDAAAMDEISEVITGRIEVLAASITGLAGMSFNINSPKQLGDILFEKLGLSGGRKNKNGYSTNADILDRLRDDHAIVGQVLEYRMLVKLKGTYIDGLPAFVSRDGKIRPHLLQTVTATGRLSCADPNLQNIPIRKEPGRQLRKAFVPESGEYVLMSADYSQIELRVLAHFSEDPSLIEDFKSGADIHSRTAARVFGVANEDDVTPL